MEHGYELRLSFTVLIAAFVHLIIFSTTIIPLFNDLVTADRMRRDARLFGNRDIIVNINQDDQQKITDKTLLSDRDSTARGFITRQEGDKWLNNSLEFTLKQGKSGSQASGRQASSRDREKMLVTSDSEISVRLSADDPYGNYGFDGTSAMVRIPDKWGITRENALFYSNDGRFSYNTAKFKHFEYFRAMKNRIASNWFPPILANSYIFGYAPGYTRIMAIPSQEVKLYFIMDREGTVQKVQIVDSMGNTPLDKSCLDAIRLSKSFGKVPDDIKGQAIVIPFIFGYYVE
ncbi:MAG: energy transducer TonB [Spirochaetes bacterium]|nr:energy transducer TonB [Spirochaetota bacterium]